MLREVLFIDSTIYLPVGYNLITHNNWFIWESKKNPSTPHVLLFVLNKEEKELFSKFFQIISAKIFNIFEVFQVIEDGMITEN